MNIPTETDQDSKNLQASFYNLDCPEIVGNSVEGNRIDLRSYTGSVIIIQFSKFYREDLPKLVYLQNLVDKNRKLGIFLVFVNTRGKHDSTGIGKIVYLAYPIIEDDGTIRAQFNAYSEDTIIIDRNFKIKYKSSRFNKHNIYDEVAKWTDINVSQQKSRQREDLFKSINNFTYYDVMNNEVCRMNQASKKMVVTSFTSLCTGCDENSRVQLLEALAKKIDSDKGEIFLIFGKGNMPDAIRQYAIVHKWNEYPMNIGVIQDSALMNEDLYYRLFDLDVDPKTFVFNSMGDSIFIETRKNTNSVDLNSLIRMVK